jgi:hypothetical protein
MLDKPVSGRIFFEQTIRDNLDIGRPDQVALIFGRQVRRNTPGMFRTRVSNASTRSPRSTWPSTPWSVGCS